MKEQHLGKAPLAEDLPVLSPADSGIISLPIVLGRAYLVLWRCFNFGCYWHK